jgi:Fe-S-cluster-containing hydrogenase component 2
MPIKGLKADSAKCCGCHLCRLSCTMCHFQETNPKKAALRIEAKFPEPGHYKVWVCTQCGTCAEVCPEGAFYEEKGIYKLDPDKCTLCLSCVEECPEGVIFTHKDIDHVIKCDYCGLCVYYCPTGCLFEEQL